MISAPLDHAASWQRIRSLLDSVALVADRDGFLDECLDRLVELLGADRGMILLSGEHGGTHVINARAQGRALSAYEREEVSKSIVREATKAGTAILWEAKLDDRGSESMLQLGILSALVVPFVGFGGVSAGVVYLDFRDARRDVGELDRQFLDTSAVLISLVLEQTGRVSVVQRELSGPRSHDPHRVAPPSLEEMLRPPSMQEVREEIETALAGRLPIVILGDTGSGKTVLAQAVAEASGRTPIMRATLGSSDDLNTITSELFGHERGSFSGAVTKRTGLVEYADQGTLILDEVLNLPQHAQQLLLDFTQFGTFRPLGHDRSEPKRASVRIIAATNGDLDLAMREGRFRRDLYYRLASVTLRLPSLRQRKDEIPMLAEAYLRRADPAREWHLSLEARRMLMGPANEWPGNLRQLESLIERARERALAKGKDGGELTPEHLASRDLGGAARAPSDPKDLGASWLLLQEQREMCEERERALITLALAKHHGVAAHAARELGIARTSLLSRMQTLGVAGKPAREKKADEPA